MRGQKFGQELQRIEQPVSLAGFGSPTFENVIAGLRDPASDEFSRPFSRSLVELEQLTIADKEHIINPMFEEAPIN